MRNEVEMHCRLQIARGQRLKKYPGELGPEQDICDVTLWLRQMFPNARARLLIDRHYAQRGRQFAGVAVVSKGSDQASLTPKALEAFLALGYKIQDMGSDTYCCPACHGHHSKHETLAAYARIEKAVRAWRQR